MTGTMRVGETLAWLGGLTACLRKSIRMNETRINETNLFCSCKIAQYLSAGLRTTTRNFDGRAFLSCPCLGKEIGKPEVVGVLGSVFAATQTRLSSSDQSRENEEDGTEDQFGRILDLRELGDTHFCPNFDRSLQQIRERDLNRTRTDSVTGIAFLLLFPVNCKKVSAIVRSGSVFHKRNLVTGAWAETDNSTPRFRKVSPVATQLKDGDVANRDELLRQGFEESVTQLKDGDVGNRDEDAPYAHNPTNIPAPNATLPLPGLKAASVEDGAALLLISLTFTGPVTDAKPDEALPDDSGLSGGTTRCRGRAGGRAGRSSEILKRDAMPDDELIDTAADKEGKKARLEGTAPAPHIAHRTNTAHIALPLSNTRTCYETRRPSCRQQDGESDVAEEA
ncbi:hypothetical protein C8R45DRAFT_1078580 [Mycena sanguinolenta]|nr:hypothetical protein C8R45DRAFT_1078580 [Mycena sanguinolenta]